MRTPQRLLVAKIVLGCLAVSAVGIAVRQVPNEESTLTLASPIGLSHASYHRAEDRADGLSSASGFERMSLERIALPSRMFVRRSSPLLAGLVSQNRLSENRGNRSSTEAKDRAQSGLLADEDDDDDDDGDDEEPTPKPKSKPKKAPTTPTGKHFDTPPSMGAAAKKRIDDALAAYRKAFGASERRDKLFKDAIRKLETAARDKESGSIPVTHFYLGSAYRQLRNSKKALPALEKAVEIASDFYQAHVLLAETLSSDARLKDSLVHFDKSLEIKPSYERAQRGRIELLVKLGEYQNALDALDTFLKKKKIPIFSGEEGDDVDVEIDEELSMLLYLRFELQRELKGTGWKEEFIAETENYRVKTSVSNEFGQEIADSAELIRKAYIAVFPNIKRPERKYDIVIYGSRNEYLRGGAPPSSAGYYTPLLRKLVFYKAPKKEDTLIVLNHEAFHQFLHEYLELAPQWFNEGLGDYFGPFEYVKQGRKEFMVSKPNSWRIRYVQAAIRADEAPEVGDLMLMSREEMYSGDAGLHYAMAWSLIYFMLEGGRPFGYDQLLVKYFQALRKGAGIDGAYDETFGRIDMEKFGADWKDFTLKIKATRR
jgi:tetratricopeptide (TPR) repeat protein